MSSCRILVVEDESIVAMDIEDRLASMGYELAGRTASGEQALLLIDRQRPDLVLMDIHLQGIMDGITAAEEIRGRFHLPVIFLTAFAEDSTLERAKLAEPYGYVLKPFNDRELKSSIEIALYRHRAESEIRRLNRLYDVLSQVNQGVVRARSADELLPAVCRLAVERGGVDLAWIGWLDPASSRIDSVASFGTNSEMLRGALFSVDNTPEGQGNPGNAIREGRPFICNECPGRDCLYPPVYAPARFGFQSCGSFPISRRGQVCGSLNLCTVVPGFFREREVELLQEVALDVSFALDRIDDEARRVRAEAALRESEERFRHAMEATSDGLWDWDIAAGTVYYSPGYSAMLGYEPGQFPATADAGLNLVHPEDRELVQKANEACIRNESPSIMVEFRMRSRDGTWRWILGRGKAIRRDVNGYALQMIGTHVDITERKRSEEEKARTEAQLRQAQKMEALGTLAGGIAHDFNNILGIIIGFTELALMDAKGAGMPGLREVLNAANRAKELVRQILAFSRMSEQERRPVQVGLIVKEAMKMLRASLPSTIEITVDAASKAVIMGDPTQIHQILINLCTNAAHAMRDGGGVLDVSLTDVTLRPEDIPPHSGLKPGPYLDLTVTDSGHGIHPSIIERIFDPFFTTKEQGVGSGLGLSVVHGIVKSHGGSIEAESSPGKGSSFRVRLPVMNTAPMPARVGIASLPTGRERILVVDDEPMLARATKQMLERLGYEVDWSVNGQEALDLFRRRSEDKPFDLVITDLTMPQLTGVDLARELLQLRPALPILLCTGFSEKIDAEQARLLGIRGVLMKPVEMRDLAGLIRKTLDGCNRPVTHGQDRVDNQ